MKNIFKAALVAVMMTAAVPAKADAVLLGLSLFKFDNKTEGPVIGDGESANTFYDLKIGKESGKLYWGGIYSTATTSAGGAEAKRTALGATIGYHNKGFILDFSYFLQAEYETPGGGEYSKGSGMALDFGYNHMMSSSFFLGLQMSYRSFTFKEYNSVSSTNKISSQLYPMVNLGFMF